MPSKPKPYNLTYLIRLFAVAMFVDHFFVPSRRKPYEMFYIRRFYKESNIEKGNVFREI